MSDYILFRLCWKTIETGDGYGDTPWSPLMPFHTPEYFVRWIDGLDHHFPFLEHWIEYK